jgi:hypothetical protein
MLDGARAHKVPGGAPEGFVQYQVYHRQYAKDQSEYEKVSYLQKDEQVIFFL